MLTVERFTFNPFYENTYLLYSEERDCIIIDPGCFSPDEKEELTHFIVDKKLNPVSIFLTHSHIDHVLGLNHIKAQFNVPIIAHALAEKGLKSTELVAQLYGLRVDTPPSIDTMIGEGDELDLGTSKLSVLFCPGHSPDHLVLYCPSEGFAIVGDVIFKESIGRTDLPGGNYDTLMNSIHQKLLVLPSSTILYPGHGAETTIKQEITHNPFLK